MLRFILSLMVARTAINILRRFSYPFIPQISTQLQVSETTIQSIVGLGSGFGIGAPLYRAIMHPFPSRVTLLMACTLGMLASFGAAVHPRLWTYTLLIIVSGLIKSVFDPIVQSLVASKIPYQQRGFAVGLIEMSWSLALIASSVVGAWVLRWAGLSGLFAFLGTAFVVGSVLIWREVPANAHPNPTDPTVTPSSPAQWMRDPRLILSAVITGLYSFAGEITLINYSPWLNDRFGGWLGIIVVTTVVIAVAEALGELLVAFGSDRVGIRLFVNVCYLGTIVGYLLLPFSTFALWGVIVVLGGMFIFIEGAVVAGLAFMTEVAPPIRIQLLSATYSASQTGHMLGAVTGALLYQWLGFHMTALVSVTLIVVAYVCLLALFRLAPPSVRA